jgi:hypothetical protein
MLTASAALLLVNEQNLRGKVYRGTGFLLLGRAFVKAWQNLLPGWILVKLPNLTAGNDRFCKIAAAYLPHTLRGTSGCDPYKGHHFGGARSSVANFRDRLQRLASHPHYLMTAF